MTPRPSRPVRLLASALTAGALLITAACSDDGDGGSGSADVTGSPSADSPAAASGAALTEAGAQAALVTEADLEDDWSKVTDAATWRDKLLVGTVDVADFLTAKADAADCQKLLDSLHGEDLLGKPSGASALTGFEQGDSRLLYQVAAYDRAALDDSFTWLKSLPTECDSFTVTDGKDKRTVEVIETSLPEEGDARQGLRVTVRGTVDGAPTTLTLDVAAVRVGSDALTVTAGGLDGDESDSTKQAAKLGTQRLKDVQAGKTPSADPGEQD
ncbi:hypothetical protein OG985_10100 [Streptomyces sp. NBC_00289]|uniref:hypothetical protein n=1 Tax=Streptomyces sp. NBC_00289 TaxID=2975703 RepID=UPI003255F035